MHISEAEIKAVSESCTVSRFYSNPILHSKRTKPFKAKCEEGIDEATLRVTIGVIDQLFTRQLLVKP